MTTLRILAVRPLLAMLAPAALAFAALSGCGKSPTATTPTTGPVASERSGTSSDPVRVGVMGAFTGGSSAHGVAMRDSVRLAAEEINNAGGVLGGRKIELVERDDQGNNERGAQVMQDLINSQKVVAVLGPINTGVAQASYRYPMAAKVPFFINVATGADVNEHFKNSPENFVFGLRANDLTQSEVIAAAAVDKRGFKKVAIMADDTNYGQNGRDLLEKALAKRGITPVTVAKFKIKDTDMTPQIQAARDAGAEAVLTYGVGPECAQIANGMERLGYKVPMIGSWTLSVSNFIDAAGPNAAGVMMPQTFIQGQAGTEKAKTFVAAYLKKYHPPGDRIPSAVATAQGYDSLNLLVQAINQAGSTDGTKIKEALESLQKPYEGVVGVYNRPFSPTDHEAIKKELVSLGMIQEGRVVPADTAAR